MIGNAFGSALTECTTVQYMTSAMKDLQSETATYYHSTSKYILIRVL
jgi:hypothetical protein